MTSPSIIPMKPMDSEPIPLPKELQEQLSAPLPAEAITTNERHSHLSSIKPAYVIERMNQVFGIGGYRTTNQTVTFERVVRVFKKDSPQQYEREQFVGTVHGTLEIPKYHIHLENYGGSENDDLGDALKGAATDAFTKMCSYLGVGLDVYKGAHDRAKGEDMPKCPTCGKKLRKSSKVEGEFYCWKAKEGCGWNGTLEELKAPAPGKPSHGTQQPRPEPAPTDPSKITISAKVVDRKSDESGKLWLKVGERTCVTMQPDVRIKLARAFIGAHVELLVSALSGSNGHTIYQIHKVISLKPPTGGE